MGTDDGDRESADAGGSQDDAPLDPLAGGIAAFEPLAGGVAHELNNILGIILGNAELAAMDADLSPSVRTSVDEIVKAGRHGSRLVQQILAFRRGQPIAAGLTDWEAMVREATRLLRASLPEGIDLEVSIVEKPRGNRSPMAEPARMAAAMPTGAEAAPAGSGRILFLDDEEAMVTLAVRMLGRHGLKAEGFVQPEKALAAFERDPTAFDLIVTDYNMPRISGFDVARQVARLRPDLPVMVTTGHITDELRRSAAEAGVRHLVEKPDTMDQLCRAVEKAIAGNRR